MVRIEIVSDIKKRMQEDNEFVKRVINGKEKIKPAVKTIITTPEIFSKIFSPERIKVIMHSKDLNIYQLAKKLGRKYEAVHRDVKYLEGFGLLKMTKNDNKHIPVKNGPIQIAEIRN